MNTKELIDLAMKQQILSDEMIELLSAFKGIEMECNHSKEMTWAKIYLLGFEIGKQNDTEFTMDALDFALKFRRLKPEQKVIVRTKMEEALKIKNAIKGL
ncbi:hypothetical protein [Clostridium sp. ZBS12]|uniref:hypothetical protein n=1 Tax=Clostridium sp. ZBS12 TaxID=2949972 RepID=UPI00207AF274|nr:hypothetical protein [Clostridium sp. ZBS12]